MFSGEDTWSQLDVKNENLGRPEKSKKYSLP